MTTVYQALAAIRGAQAILSDRDGWTTRHSARTPDGSPVDPLSPFATQFCLLGALYRSCAHVEAAWAEPGRMAVFHLARDTAKGAALGCCGTTSLTLVNDHYGYEAVCGVLRLAGEALSQ